MTVRSYQVCTNCVMDTTDSRISFDKNGVCDHCIDFKKNVKPNWYPNDEGTKRLNKNIYRQKKMVEIGILIVYWE